MDYPVEYACDEDDNHQADMADCTQSNIKTFETEEGALNFITHCTYVYNLDTVLGNSVDIDIVNPILDSLVECRV